MAALLSIAVVLSVGYSAYARAKRNGDWSWLEFFGIIGAIALLTVGFILPVVSSKSLQAHIGLFFTVLLGGIFGFIVLLVIVLRKLHARPNNKRAP